MRYALTAHTLGHLISISRQDDYRLPEGMKRVGYDSDSGRYYFRDSEGKMYEGPEGSEFGEMTRGEFH